MKISNAIATIIRNFGEKSTIPDPSRNDHTYQGSGEEIQELCSAIESRDPVRMADVCEKYAEITDPKIQALISFCTMAGNTRLQPDRNGQDKNSPGMNNLPSGVLARWSSWILATNPVWFGTHGEKNLAAARLQHEIEKFSLSDDAFEELVNQVTWDIMHEKNTGNLNTLLVYLVQDPRIFQQDNPVFSTKRDQIVDIICSMAVLEVNQDHFSSAAGWLNMAADILED